MLVNLSLRLAVERLALEWNGRRRMAGAKDKSPSSFLEGLSLALR
jgi:hypothetical protein